MKIAITGTTRGIGLACKKYFSEVLNYTVIEYNRPEHDLSKNIDTFITTDFDIYINNAYSDWAQVDLLYKLFEANKDRSCIIINIGSVSADGNYDYANPYAIHKVALDRACMQLQLVNTSCRIVQFKLGRVDTDMVAHRIGPKMKPEWIAQQIASIANYPYNVVPKCIVLDNLSNVR